MGHSVAVALDNAVHVDFGRCLLAAPLPAPCDAVHHLADRLSRRVGGQPLLKPLVPSLPAVSSSFLTFSASAGKLLAGFRQQAQWLRGCRPPIQATSATAEYAPRANMRRCRRPQGFCLGFPAPVSRSASPTPLQAAWARNQRKVRKQHDVFMPRRSQISRNVHIIRTMFFSTNVLQLSKISPDPRDARWWHPGQSTTPH